MKKFKNIPSFTLPIVDLPQQVDKPLCLVGILFMEKTWKIYKTTCLVNGKVYIGQTTKSGCVLNRYFGSGKKILRAIYKYRRSNFTKEILTTCNTQKDANIQELYFIKKYNSTDNEFGYNILNESYIDYQKHSNLISSLFKEGVYKKRKKRVISEEKKLLMYKEIGEKLKGRVFSEETILKMSISAKNRVCSEEARKRLSIRYSGKGNIMYGKKHSESSKEKNRNSQIGSKSKQAKKVEAICLKSKEVVKSFNAIVEAKEWLGAGNISLCLRGKCHTAGGYYWRYSN
jgi:group I intron endonuclease